jgi:hypothetical protein
MIHTIRRMLGVPPRPQASAATLAAGNARWTPAVSFGVSPLPEWATYTGGPSAVLHRAGMPDAVVQVLEVKGGGPTGVQVLARWPLGLVGNPGTITAQPRYTRALVCPEQGQCYYLFCLPTPTPDQPGKMTCVRAGELAGANRLANPYGIEGDTGRVWSVPGTAVSELHGQTIDGYRDHSYTADDGSTWCDVMTSSGLVTLPILDDNLPATRQPNPCCEDCAAGRECSGCSGDETESNPFIYQPELSLRARARRLRFLPHLFRKALPPRRALGLLGFLRSE